MTKSPDGFLMIGDPHLASRQPGFRIDDYMATTLDKVAQCLRIAQNHNLLPVFLGDLFHVRRDNSNVLLSRLLAMLRGVGALGIAGNHDMSHNTGVMPEDTLAVVMASGVLHMLDGAPWRGTIAGRSVVLGGSSYGSPIPESWKRSRPDELVAWVTHHDLRFPGDDEAEATGRLDLCEIPGIDVVVNGHLHNPRPPVLRGRTYWLNPGSITRTRRSEASMNRVPCVTALTISGGTWRFTSHPLRVRPADEVFVPVDTSPAIDDLPPQQRGDFVAALTSIQSLRTADGSGLRQFIEANLPSMPPRVRPVILNLMERVSREETTD